MPQFLLERDCPDILYNLTPTCLPQPFHRGPADQMGVATGRFHDWALMAMDSKNR
jgi:PIN domain nuclease of toxin-antitoxin system